MAPTPMPADPSLLTPLDDDASLEAGTQFAELIAGYLAQTHAGEGRVGTTHAPAELAAQFAGPLPAEGKPLAAVLERLRREILPNVTRLTHPMYMGHQVSAPLPAAIWTEALISALNNSTAVQEMAPAVTILEHQVVRAFAALAGWSAEAGGTLTSGGTEATFTALLAARAEAMPEAWEAGVGADPPVVVYGEQSHYAVTRAIGALGLGLRNGIAVPTRDFRMDTDQLRAILDRLHGEGRRVMAVVATAGSTPTGSFDDLAVIGRLCAERGLWLHVDGAHGASALFSAVHRHRLAGLELATSLAWDPHKMMLLPLSAGMVLVKTERQLDQAFAQRAPYLFHGRGAERVWDQGVRSFQCSRRADALKLWVALERYGTRAIGALYDRLCATTQALHAQVLAHPSFAAVHAPASNILCFRYVGRPGRASPAPEEEARLDRVNFELRQRYNRSGEGWITTTVLGGRRVLRCTLMNPRTTAAHLERLLTGLAATGVAVERQGAA
ncbi:MAG: pyridoxal-dependent decarboxylase [Gemmatimonadetes bacterium]|nr:pyridoxal-dependent decarboxylase [Gemmatimonadota bacterium]